MSVIGVRAPKIQSVDGPVMQVYVEVHNPTSRTLRISRLKYRLVAESWFDSIGQVKVDRLVAAGGSAIVEIEVSVKEEGATRDAMQGVNYTLEGRLFAVADQVERSWKLSSTGALVSSGRSARRGLRVADAPKQGR